MNSNEQFCKWATRKGYDLSTCNYSLVLLYSNCQTNAAWDAWQGRGDELVKAGIVAGVDEGHADITLDDCVVLGEVLYKL